MPTSKIRKTARNLFMLIVLVLCVAMPPHSGGALSTPTLCCRRCHAEYDSCFSICQGDTGCEFACNDRLAACAESCSPGGALCPY